MPRRREVPKRVILPDPKFGSVQVAKFINVLMKHGKKSIAEGVLYDALNTIEGKGKVSIETLTLAIDNVKPNVEVKSRRVGGANYPVPIEVPIARRSALAMRWLSESSSKRSEKSMSLRLANELLDASEKKGGAIKKRDDVHRMAEANKAFSHFRFN